MNLAAKFEKLQTLVGGHRLKTEYEFTFGMPAEERYHVARPSRWNTRILGELEYAIALSQEENNRFHSILEAAVDMLLVEIEKNGVLTDAACQAAEESLLPMQEEAKSYTLLLASHAHIDMNWEWSYNETVAIALATFRSILNIMDQYPDFTFSQSQGAVYQIVEQYDPAMMEEIKKRIREGRWEVTASAWVETDKNMPSGESLLRHIEYTKEYLRTKWGVDDVSIDFSPDTFGHSAFVPEIDAFGSVKYYYHCRGNSRDQVLYRYQAPSGKEVLIYREPNWYNGAITTHAAAGVPKISRLSGGLKTAICVYGVGDHGGGPTRRDVERAIDMMDWKIYPVIRFGTFREYFEQAETVREKLPVVDQELNVIFPGCYTTQSRIKRANRRMEAALYDTEAIGALAAWKAGTVYRKAPITDAWTKVLFNHFHDILTGSCVQDSREFAMGQFQLASSAANSQLQNDMRSIGLAIDTSSIPVDLDVFNSQSEGAGAGYGLENYVGVPSTERGSGRTRIFHIFNSLAYSRTELAELTVWDWTGNLSHVSVSDEKGKPLAFQMVDTSLQKYWDHMYFRVLVEVTVPPVGYTTVVLREKEPDTTPVFLSNPAHQVGPMFDNLVLDNGIVRAEICAYSGRVISLKEVSTGKELVSSRLSAGLSLAETETETSSAWNIGRVIKLIPVDKCIALAQTQAGPLRQSVKASYEIASSKVEVTYSLDKGSPAVRIELTIDWNEAGVGKSTIPVLRYDVPTGYETSEFRYDVPAGSLVRKAMHNDVPGLRYGMALGRKDDGGCLMLASDSKYGFRGCDNMLTQTLINSSVSPDPYPERGIHHITLWLGVCENNARKAQQLADTFNHAFFYQPSNSHTGTLPMTASLLEASSDSFVVSSVQPTENGVLVRGYEDNGRDTTVTLRFSSPVRSAERVNLMETGTGEAVSVEGSTVSFPVSHHCLAEVLVELG